MYYDWSRRLLLTAATSLFALFGLTGCSLIGQDIPVADEKTSELNENTSYIEKNKYISVSGGGVKIDGRKISITQGGRYIISGDYDNYAIHIVTPEIVSLSLKGANISSDESSTIFCDKTDSMIILETENDTHNSISNTSEPCETQGDNEGYDDNNDDDDNNGDNDNENTEEICDLTSAIFTAGSIRLGGGGTLDIDSENSSAIRCDGSFTVENGSNRVSGFGECVVSGGDFTLDSGQLYLTQADVGVQAKTVLINGGELYVSTEQFAFSDAERITMVDGSAYLLSDNFVNERKGKDISYEGGRLFYGYRHDNNADENINSSKQPVLCADLGGNIKVGEKLMLLDGLGEVLFDITAPRNLRYFCYTQPNLPRGEYTVSHGGNVIATLRLY